MLFFPTAGSFWLAGKVQTALANCKVRLFQSPLVPDVNTTEADLVAAEADFTGYAEVTLTTVPAPFNPAEGGTAIQIPTQQFTSIGPFTTPNTVNGAWIEDSTGKVVAIDTFSAPIPISAQDQAVPVAELIRFVSGL